MDSATYAALIEIGKIFITAILTTGLIFFKDYKLDYKARKRTTRILAIKIHYILKKFVVYNADKLHDNDIAKQTKFNYQGHLASHEGTFCRIPKKLNLTIEDIDWKDLDTTIISNITKLDINIFCAEKDIYWVACFEDEEKAVELAEQRIKTISMDALNIIGCLEEKYDIPKSYLKYNGESLENIFK